MKTKLTTKTLAILVCVVMVIAAFAAVAAARAERCDCGGTIRLVGDSDVLVNRYTVDCRYGNNTDWVYVYNTIRTWQCPDCGYGYSFVNDTWTEQICNNGGSH